MTPSQSKRVFTQIQIRAVVHDEDCNATESFPWHPSPDCYGVYIYELTKECPEHPGQLVHVADYDTHGDAVESAKAGASYMRPPKSAGKPLAPPLPILDETQPPRPYNNEAQI